MSQTTSPMAALRHEPVAIVGIGCRFPGGVVDPLSFWRVLIEGTDAIGEIPRDRIAIDRYFDPVPATPGRMMTRYGGFLDHLPEFDAVFFGISPREAASIDPQQRLLLETAWEALEDAGENVRRLQGSRTAVFVGQWISDFEARLFADPETVDFAMTTGSGRYASSGRISYVFGFRGPSFTIDSACSSSLTAVHLGVRSIRSGEADLALAGGVNVILQPQISIAYSQSRMMAADGRCKFGDASGDGYVRSEGAGLVVLKALDKAIADGDRVYAVVRGSAVNNDGRSSGSMGTPSRTGQEELLRQAYRDAGIEPGCVDYIEAHGTGTRVGDPVELSALGTVLGEGRDSGKRAFVGSIKTNIGHTEGAAGVAGLIKIALSLHHQAIPPTLHCQSPNPAIEWSDFPLHIVREPVAWPRVPGRPRIAGVSAFGIAGTNAHAVLEEAPPPTPGDPPRPGVVSLLTVSAKTAAALGELIARYAAQLERTSDDGLNDVCWSAATRRTALEHRAAFIAPDRGAMADALRGYTAGVLPAAAGVAPDDTEVRVAFVCPGQGAQWVGMARELRAREPLFREALAACDAAARPYLACSIVEQLHIDPDAPEYRLDRIDVIQPVLVALAIAYARLWQARGVEPDVIIGHSMGEVAAAHIAGVLDLDQAMRIVCRRSALMRGTSGHGAMALVDLSFEEAVKRLAGRNERIGVAVSNSPRSCVVSGEAEAVRGLLGELEADGVFCRLVNVDVASHSPQMDEPAAQLARELVGLAAADARVPIVSTVLARRAEGREFGAAYWGRNLREPVRFGVCIEALLTEHAATVFIELGPHPILTTAVEQTANAIGVPTTAVACGRRDESDIAALQGVAATLWAAGADIDWKRWLTPGRIVAALPSYPWQRERCWAREAELVDAGAQSRRTAPLSQQQQGWLHRLAWVESPTAASSLAARPRRGSVLLVGVHASAAQPYIDAFADCHTPVHVTDDLRGAAALLHGETPTGPADIVLVAGGAADLPDVALSLLRSLVAGEPGAVRPRLTFATRGAQAVEGHPRSRVAVDQATLWGLGRVIAEEHPELWGGLVDVDPAADAKTQAVQLAAAVSRLDAETQLAFRDGRRFALRLRALDADPPERASEPWPSDGAWLLTGGLGDIGLHLAAGMVAQGVRRLILLGRNPLPPREQWLSIPPESRDGRRIAAVRALERAGAAVHLIGADVADSADVERALRTYEDEAWPPIRGVLHAAGVLETALASRTDRATLHRVLAPKLQGALNLDRLLPQVDRFVMISSFSATLGVPGTASYAAANAGLDALAHDRRARGLHGLSIQSGGWAETGMNAGASSAQQTMGQLSEIGIREFTPAQGVALFNAIAGRSEAAITVMPIDWSRFAAARRGHDLKLYEFHVAGAPAEGGGVAIGDRLASATVAERRQIVEPLVREAVGQVLRLAPSHLDSRKPLGAMGLSSLMAMELRNRLESAFGRRLSATLAWNYPTVDALVAFLGGETPATIEPVATAHATIAVESVAGLSDGEAARLLRRNR